MNIIAPIRDLRTAFRDRPWPLEKPVVVQFPVNDICNARCQMCHIWKKKLDYQISVHELQGALANSLYSEVRTVGLNGGEPTLRRDLPDIVDVMFRMLPKLRNVSVITNGLVAKRVIRSIEEVGNRVKQHGGKLDVMVSLDGVGDVHDRVRGREGNFENAVKVIDFARRSPVVSRTRLGCTVIRENIYGLHDLLDFARHRDVYIKYRLGVPHRRLYTQDLRDPFALTPEEKVHFATFLENLVIGYETDWRQIIFYRSLIGQLAEGKGRSAGCDWQHRGATINSRGQLMYCAVESKDLGSVVGGDSNAHYFGHESYLREIVKNKCPDCAHDYSGLPGGGELLRHYYRHARDRLPVFRHAAVFLSRSLFVRHRVSACRFRHAENRMGVQRGATRVPARKMKWRPGQGRGPSVMLVGWYGTETLGDKAILGAIVTQLRKYYGDSMRPQLASIHPHISRLTVSQMPELEGMDVISLASAEHNLQSADLVVFAGGPVMAIHELSVIRKIFQQAAALAVPVLVAGCGVGPFGTRPHNGAIGDILGLSSSRIYRDDISSGNAIRLGVDTTRDRVAEDPAFTWVNNAVSTAGEIQSRDGGKSLLLGLRDWPYTQYATKLGAAKAEALKYRYEQAIVAVLERLIREQTHINVIPFPMCTNSYGGDDRFYYRKLFADSDLIQEHLDVSVLSRELRPADALRYFMQADTVLGMRYHSIIFAVALGKPVIALDYTLGSGKVASLMNSHHIPGWALDQIDETALYRQLIDCMTQSLAPHSVEPVFPRHMRAVLDELTPSA